MKQFEIIVSDLFRNIWAGTRLVLFLPFQRDLFTFNYVQALLLLLVSFGVSFGYDYYTSVPDNHFSFYGLNYQATLYLLFFISIFVITYLQQNLKSFLSAIVILQSIVPAISLIYIGVLYMSGFQYRIDPELVSWLVFLAYLAWYLVVVFRLIRDFYQVSAHRGLVLVGLYAAINIGPLFFIPNQPLWYAMPALPGPEQNGLAGLNVEDTYYAQNALVASSAGNLFRQRPGIIDLYFLGFAGDASEDVFMNEANHVKALFDEHFDTRGRSIVLINNMKTLQTHPLASAHNLDLVLQEIAGRMDTGEDVLFLFMTSHGSADQKLSASFDLLLLNDITPGMIRSAIDRAGIQWSIIVISACYSGAFIDLLKNDRSLVITASSGDRNSFGCGHDGEFTYFGEVFFGKHLPNNHSFVSAFHLAREDIESREKQEGKIPSQPQIFLGKEIQQKLDLLTEQLENRERNNWARSGTDIVKHTSTMEHNR